MDHSEFQNTQSDAVPDDAGIDLPAALTRLGGDRQLLRDMAQVFVEDAPGLLKQVQSGEQSDNAEPAWRAAHSLKGLASNFSNRAAAAAQTAEDALRSGDDVRIQKSLAALSLYVQRLISELQRTVLHA